MKKILILLIAGMMSATIINADGWNDMRNVDSKISKDSKVKPNQKEKKDRFKKEDNSKKDKKTKERKPLW